MSTLRGRCLKEIIWGPEGKAYRAGDQISGSFHDMTILENMHVIVINRVDTDVEVATVHTPENTARRTKIPLGR